MPNVLAKIETSSKFQHMCDTLTEIVQEEFEFTCKGKNSYKELRKIYEQTNNKDKEDLNRQISLNGEIFRVNFGMIVQNLGFIFYFSQYSLFQSL